MLPTRTLLALVLLLMTTCLVQAQDTPERQLQDAAYGGDFAEIKRLVTTGVDINTRKEPGSTPLYYATLNQHEDIALFLIEKGASLNRRGGPKKDTPLMNAAAFDELSVIRALLCRGARTNLRCDEGMTAREHAVRNHHPEAAKLLRSARHKPTHTL